MKLKKAFPGIKQKNGRLCIPACIENVLQYLEHKFDDNEIQDAADKFLGNGINFKNISEMLRNKYPNLEFNNVGRAAFNDHEKHNYKSINMSELKEMIDSNLEKDIPLILCMPHSFLRKACNLYKRSASKNWHSCVCTEADKNSIVLFDPSDEYIKISYQSIEDNIYEQNLANIDILLITKKLKS